MIQGNHSISPGAEETVQIKVPRDVKRQLVMLAAERNETLRTVVLRALSNFGLRIDAAEILDRRKTR